jgi:hypothetical protein
MQNIHESLRQMSIEEYVLMIIGSIFSLAIHLSLLCLCLSKRKKRNLIKEQMKQRQSLYAEAMHMNYFEMINQPRFPRTMHI